VGNSWLLWVTTTITNIDDPLGGSGSGKTSLLNVIAGRQGARTTVTGTSILGNFTEFSVPYYSMVLNPGHSTNERQATVYNRII
jgi:ABC-type taurine transport system ATPase subunit